MIFNLNGGNNIALVKLNVSIATLLKIGQGFQSVTFEKSNYLTILHNRSEVCNTGGASAREEKGWHGKNRVASGDYFYLLK